MKSTNCLSEQDLLLHYYEELTLNGEEHLHLLECRDCSKRFASLNKDLASLPEITSTVDPLAGQRMAARVNEQLSHPNKKWLATAGASAVALFALVLTVSVWTPQEGPEQLIQHRPTEVTSIGLDEEMPDIDFLEDLELLKELELLSLIEGV